MLLVNARTGHTIATVVELALTRAARRRGLLGRRRFETSTALLLSPCWAIHTTFMRFAIDVVFVDRDGRAMRIVRALAPWRIAVAPRAHTAIELPAGSLQAGDVLIGDQMYVSLTPDTDADADADARLARLAIGLPATTV